MKSVGHKNVVDVWRRLKTVVIKKSDMGKFFIHLLLLLRLPLLLVQCVRKSTGWWHDGRQGVYVREWRDSTAGSPLNSNHRRCREERREKETRRDRQTVLFFFLNYDFILSHINSIFCLFLKRRSWKGLWRSDCQKCQCSGSDGIGGLCEKPIFLFSSFSASRRMGLFYFYDFFLRFFVESPRETYKNKTASFRLLPSKFLSLQHSPSRSVRV